MKKIFLALTLLIFAATSFSQNKTQTYDKAWYLKKSRHKQTTAIIFLGAGVIYTAAGFLQPDSSDNNLFGLKDKNRDAPYYFALGGICTIVSVLYFSASARFKRNALNATVDIKTQKIFLPQQNGFVYKSQPAITIKVPLY